MLEKEKKINKLFIYWLCMSLLLVYFAVLIGGLTRLTNSGLSITEWELFKGILPPLTNTSWNLYFEAYKKIPQYELLNFNMVGNLNSTLQVQSKKITDRDSAMSLKGKLLFAARNKLPKSDSDEYYFADLIGLKVIFISL